MASSMTATLLGFEPFVGTAPVELRDRRSESEIQAVIMAAYRQVFGNEYIMQSERITSAESLLRQGDISVRDFVRALAQSDLYQKKFFGSAPQVRFIELNFKHLLGRAPANEAEITYHVDLFIDRGYQAEINSYIDSPEYQDSFGDAIVPYYRGFATQRGQTTLGFNRMFKLYRGFANSDKAQGNNKLGALTEELPANLASPLRTVNNSSAMAGTLKGERGQLFRVRYIQPVSGRGRLIRRSINESVVSYEQLNFTLQRLNKSGSRIVEISCA
jgi:phycocyanin-associated rod linker protein